MIDQLDHVTDAHLEKILTHIHREAMGHVFTSVLPTSTTVPIGKTVIYDDATLNEIRVYLKTAENNLIYYRLNASGEVVVDGEINIGSYFKADDTHGMWLGASDFASAPFSVNLSGSIKATSGTIGGWDITASTIESPSDNIVLNDATSEITVGPTAGTHIQIDGANVHIRSSDYSAGVSGWNIDTSIAEFNNIRARGKIIASCFEKDTISSVGGNFMVSDSDILDADMTAADASTLTIVGDTTFAVGDILRIKDGTNDEWLTVTNIGSAPTYTVTRDGGSDYDADDNPTWQKGTAVVNYGASGEGVIFMTASEANAPYMSIITHAGAPWTTLNTRLRLGNLNGSYGLSSDSYGIGIGDYDSNVYLRYDTTNNKLIVSEIESPDYVADTTGYKLSSSSGLEINTGTIKGTEVDARILFFALAFGEA